MELLLNTDFHLHTCYSDGIMTPRELVSSVAAYGIRRMALTDHETYRGWKLLQEEGVPLGLEVIPGIELDCNLGGVEIHLLGLGFTPDSTVLDAYLEQNHAIRKREYGALLQKLNQYLGEDFLDPENTFPRNGGTWMKPHLFRRLGQHPRFKHIKTEKQYRFFKDWLQQENLLPQMPRLELEEGIKLVHEAGGLAVMAHPGYYWKHGMDLRNVLFELAETGLDGVEVFYPYYQVGAPEFPDESESIRTVCSIYHWCLEMGLDITLGSDIHLPQHLEERYPQLRRQVSLVDRSINPVDV